MLRFFIILIVFFAFIKNCNNKKQHPTQKDCDYFSNLSNQKKLNSFDIDTLNAENINSLNFNVIEKKDLSKSINIDELYYYSKVENSNLHVLLSKTKFNMTEIKLFLINLNDDCTINKKIVIGENSDFPGGVIKVKSEIKSDTLFVYKKFEFAGEYIESEDRYEELKDTIKLIYLLKTNNFTLIKKDSIRINSRNK